MKIIGTAILLFFSLLIVPVLIHLFGPPPGDIELNALKTLIIITAIVIAYSFVVGELTSNNSQVDKLWSIMPIVYTWVVAGYGNFAPKLVLMGILVTIWGVRLTINFGMKGAYQWRFWTGEEDYRWKVLRKKPEFDKRWKWTLFNLFFISGYQNILVLLITLPSIIVFQNINKPIGIFDIIIAGLMFSFIVFETIADIQQWRFQKKKHAMIKAGAELSNDFKQGFLSKGLWNRCRHPNYFAEMSVWITFYLFSVVVNYELLNWSIVGCLLLVILFIGSTKFTEEISSGKYPDYAGYKKNRHRFIPAGPINNGKKGFFYYVSEKLP